MRVDEGGGGTDSWDMQPDGKIAVVGTRPEDDCGADFSLAWPRPAQPRLRTVTEGLLSGAGVRVAGDQALVVRRASAHSARLAVATSTGVVHDVSFSVRSRGPTALDLRGADFDGRHLTFVSGRCVYLTTVQAPAPARPGRGCRC